MDWHELGGDQVLKELKTSEKGLSDSEAERRLKEYGLNELEEKKKISPLAIFFGQFKSFLVLILIFATVFSFLIGQVLDTVVILIIVILNAVFGFAQEYKAEKAIEALKKLTTPEVTVLRGGKPKKLSSRFLVPGDIVFLEQGSRISADMRLLETVDLKVDESTLTGESIPVSKNIEPLGKVALAERKNMAFSGTLVTYGRGSGLVVETGMHTEIGNIAQLIQEAEEPETPLQKNLKKFSKNLGILILGISLLVIILGIIRGGPLEGLPVTEELVLNMALTGIALAVAAIPEGLPAVVTITLALGLRRLSKQNALMRRLAAVETLGSVTAICADKTGTLTKNEMTVEKIFCNNRLVNITGRGYEPAGKFLLKNKEIAPKKDKTLSLFLTAASLCNNASLDMENKSIIGDPTEGSMVVASEKAGLKKEDLDKAYPRIREIPFTSERKMMSTVNRFNGKFLVCVKGAPEVILELSTHIEQDSVKKLTGEMKEKILDANQNMTSEALRVLAVAYKYTNNPKAAEKDLESDLVFLGLTGMIDPPRKEVKQDIILCKKAGIKTIMITGDHKNTAVAIAKEIGMFEKNHKVLTGQELEKISDQDLEEIVDDVSVYARVDPSQKVRIVEALRKKGHIIAMTGDGINDAPALKKADIGIAMGVKGTDVAKEASDMILTDDNFSSIVAAVRSGRAIYDNIKKFIQYLLSSNLGEVLIIFIAMLIGMTDPKTGLFILPLTAIQLLWINLLTDGLPALALGVDPPSPGIMEKPPRNPKEKILSKEVMSDIILVGVIMTIGVLSLFYMNIPEGAAKATTIAFTAVVIMEMVRVQAVRMKYKVGFFSNKKLILAILISIILQLFVVYLPPLQTAFETTFLGALDWLEIILVSAAILIVMEAKRRFG